MGQETSSRSHSWIAPAAVWGVWAALLLAALGFVRQYGSNVPYLDDWSMIPRIIWRADIVSWLWEPVNEHLMPVPRLVLMTLYEVSKLVTGAYDFRVGMYFNVFALAGLAAAMIRTATRLRGRTSLADAFFPLLLLNWGHCEQLLWSAHVHFVFSVVLEGALLLLIVRQGKRLALGTGLLVGCGMVVLGLCGANGLAFIPALALWLGCLGWLHWHDPTAGKKNALLLWGMALAALAMVPLMLHFSEKAAFRASNPDYATAASTALEFVTLPLTPVAEAFWPFSGFVVLLLVLLTITMLGKSSWSASPAERARLLGVVFFLGGVASLALGLGWGRGSVYGSLLESPIGLRHYLVLATPVLLGVYFAWLLGGSRRSQVVMPVCLCAVLLGTWPFNTSTGLAYGQEFRSHREAFEKDAESGQYFYQVLARHTPTLLPKICDQDYLEYHLRSLREARIGAFRSLRDNPSFQSVSLTRASATLHEAVWDDSVLATQGAGSYLSFVLSPSQYVCGVRIRLSYAGDRPSTFRMAWQRPGQEDFPERQQFIRGPLPPGEKSLLIYVDDTVDELRLYPDQGPFRCTIHEMALLVPSDPG